MRDLPKSEDSKSFPGELVPLTRAAIGIELDLALEPAAGLEPRVRRLQPASCGKHVPERQLRHGSCGRSRSVQHVAACSSCCICVHVVNPYPGAANDAKLARRATLNGSSRQRGCRADDDGVVPFQPVSVELFKGEVLLHDFGPGTGEQRNSCPVQPICDEDRRLLHGQ